MVTQEQLARAAAIAAFPIRLVQLGCAVVAGYIVGYLIWMHQNHICKGYYNTCSGYNKVMAVPIADILMIIAVS